MMDKIMIIDVMFLKLCSHTLKSNMNSMVLLYNGEMRYDR